MGVALITLHGMGDTKPEYANDLIKSLREKMDLPKFQQVRIESVYYQKILQGNERRVWNDTDAQSKVHYDALRKFVLFGFGDAAGLEHRKEDDKSAYELAQVEIAGALLKVCREQGPTCPVVFISHSLGCHVLSSYLWDAQISASNPNSPPAAGIWKNIDQALIGISGPDGLTANEKAFLRGSTCLGWITTGCNIPIFVAAHKTIKPIRPPCEGFVWKNYFDPDDILGWPLGPLSPEYAALVKDIPVNAGQGMVNWLLKSWNPLSHGAYWNDDEVVKPLAHMLESLTQ